MKYLINEFSRVKMLLEISDGFTFIFYIIRLLQYIIATSIGRSGALLKN